MSTPRHLTLDPFQSDALESLRRGRSVLVSAPTGTGKTLIADRAIEGLLAGDRQVVYTAPIKALSNQKFRDYSRLLGEDRVGLVTGDLVINRDAPLRIMTTEILRNMLLVGEPLQRLSLVVIDEIHFLDERERGTVWEELLIYLPREVPILGLSATLANIEEFAGWLRTVRGDALDVVVETRRAVPLHTELAHRGLRPLDLDAFERHVRRWSARVRDGRRDGRGDRGRDRRGRSRRGRSRPRGGGRRGSRVEPETRHHEMIALLEPHRLPCLYFVFSRAASERFARDLARRRPDGYLDGDERLAAAAEVERFRDDNPGVLSGAWARMLVRGIACHHAGLHVRIKLLVERLYERRLVHVLYCTSTFALGINMPARSVVIHELDKFDGRDFVPLTVREFQQMAGRAGRRGIDRRGHAVIRMDPEDFGASREHLQTLIDGDPEPVRSAFNLSFNSVVNLLARHDRAQLRPLLERSFLSYRAQRQVRALRTRGGRRGRKAGRRPSVWDALLRKVGVLQRIGYLDDDWGFLAGAEVLRHLQIEEVFATELVLSGVLEELDPPLLFGALCTLGVSLGHRVRAPRPSRDIDELIRTLRGLRESLQVSLAEVEQVEAVTFTPEGLPIGATWIDGAPLLEIAGVLDAPTDVTGDLVTGLRRAKDLAGQLRQVYRLGGDELMVRRLSDVIEAASRDEVEVVG